jgi:hypothetical protein
MRDPQLRDVLEALVGEAAELLRADVEAGVEVPFDLAEEEGDGAVLYQYRPLTERYIAERWSRLRELPAWVPASEALGGETEAALRVLLERVFEESTTFELHEDRFARVYEQLEHMLYGDTVRAVALVPLEGAELGQERVELGDGLALAVPGGVEVPPELVHAPALCVLERDLPGGEKPPVAEAVARFTALVTALRLFKEGGVALAPQGFARAGEGAWKSFAAGTGGGRGELWFLADGEEAELGEFLAVAAQASHGGAVAWALRRFEMGCERTRAIEALSDYLLALEALLDAGDDAGRAILPLRLAALCAEEPDRPAAQRRMEEVIALERFVIAAGGEETYLERVGSEPPEVLVAELEGNLRALLRDIVCGYLDPSLRAIADDILLRSDAPVEISARDTRPRRATPEPEPEPEPDLEPEPEPDPIQEPLPEATDRGVTASADWGFDEDPGSYSAPV